MAVVAVVVVVVVVVAADVAAVVVVLVLCSCSCYCSSSSSYFLSFHGRFGVVLCRCAHRAVQIKLDNDFEVNMLSHGEDALSVSAQLIADVAYLEVGA